MSAIQASKCAKEVILGGVYEGDLRFCGFLSLEQEKNGGKEREGAVGREMAVFLLFF